MGWNPQGNIRGQKTKRDNGERHKGSFPSGLNPVRKDIFIDLKALSQKLRKSVKMIENGGSKEELIYSETEKNRDENNYNTI